MKGRNNHYCIFGKSGKKYVNRNEECGDSKDLPAENKGRGRRI